jgi:hypothetical protein
MGSSKNEMSSTFETVVLHPCTNHRFDLGRNEQGETQASWPRRAVQMTSIEKGQRLDVAAAAMFLKPSAASLCRWWLVRIEVHEISGGKECTKLAGRDQMLMAAVYLVAYRYPGGQARTERNGSVHRQQQWIAPRAINH